MQGRLAFCIRPTVLSLALFACSTGEPTSPEDSEDPELPPIPSTVRWSEASSWPGDQVPAAGAAVVIPSGKALLLDVSPPALASLRVEGALVFDEQDLDLTAGHTLVQGTFRVGTSAAPFQHRATITLTGTLADGDIMGMGNRVLGVAGGTLDLHGESRTGWTRLSSTVAAGSTQLLLEDAPDWRAGDKLVVASTDFDPNHAEVATISAVSGATVTLAEPLGFSHYGELQTIAGRTVDERAEVGLLTRNVVVRGDSATSQEGGYGGHIMGTGGTLRVSGVMLRFMGQKGLVARYPMHWHVMGPVDGQFFTGSSVWKSFNRCVTVHGTDNARVEGNVCHSHLGHPGRAVWLRGRDHRLSSAVLADNAIGATFASSETFVEDALFVGESSNNAGAVFNGAPRRGYEFYDGRVGADRVTFANYTAAGSIPSSALGFNRNNGFSVSTGNFAGDVAFINANQYYLETPHDDKDGDKAAVFLDRDGDVTGSAGVFVVPNHPFLVTPACTSRPEWNAYVCPQRYVGLSVRSDDEVVAPLTLTRDDAAALTLVGVPDNPNSAHASLLPGRSYTVQFAGAAPLRPRINLSRTVEGEWARLTLPYPQASLRVIRDFNGSSPLTAAVDLAELEASPGDRYWYDSGTGMLHLKLVTRTGRTSATIQVEPQ